MISQEPCTLPSELHRSDHAADLRAWPEHFPAPRSCGVANKFHHAVRGGHTKPATAIHQVQQEVWRRLQWANNSTDDAHLCMVLEALQTDRAGALPYAQSVLHWEALPHEERQRLKAERTAHYQQTYMAQLPVT